MDENHKRFLQYLEESRIAVVEAALWLQSHGFDVQLGKMQYAPEHKDWKEYSDDGDLFILKPINIKRLSIAFTGQDDFPYRNIIVCTKHSWDQAKIKPEAVMLFSSDMKTIAIVKRETSPSWAIGEIEDKRYDPPITQSCYVCPKELICFRSNDSGR